MKIFFFKLTSLLYILFIPISVHASVTDIMIPVNNSNSETEISCKEEVLDGSSTLSLNDFVTTWKTNNPGDSNSTSIKIPLGFGTYNYDVDWNNDGVFDQFGITGTVTHDFGVAGTYTIRIQGDFPHIYFNALEDKDKILEVNQWGNQQWGTMINSFTECTNFNVTATDNPDLSICTSLFQTFRYCPSFNGDISGWDTSNIDNMFGLFYGATIFNQDISSWNTVNVTHMGYMFGEALAFNQNIGGWNTSSAVNMNSMFYQAALFNQNLNWNTTGVTDMGSIFREATNFNGDITTWNVSNVQDMSLMFHLDTAFNQDISGWTTSSVTLLYDMFNQATAFNQNLGSWDVSNVTDAGGMFDAITLSTVNYDALLNGWDAQSLQSNVLFSGGNSKYCAGETARNNMIASDSWTITDGGKDPSCGLVDSDHFVTTWKTDNLSSGSTSSTSIDIPTRSIYTYFYDVDWNNDGTFDEFGLTGNATHNYGVAGTYTVRIRGDFPLIYFNNTGDRKKILSVDQWGTQHWVNQNYAFYGCSNLDGNAVDNPDLSGVTSLTGMFRNCSIFNGDISGWDVSNVKYFTQMFKSASLFNQNIGGWTTNSALRMSVMFSQCTNFDQNLNGWNVSSVTDMGGMFVSCANFNQNLNSWNTGSVIYMSSMFYNASNFNGDISSWNTTNVTQMNQMFQNALAFNQNIGSWNVTKVKYFQSMFENASSFNQNIGSWVLNNTSSIDVAEMFQNAIVFNQDIGGWNTFRITNFRNMFNGAIAFNQDISAWDVSKITYAAGMFDGVTLSTANYDALLIGWDAQALQPNVTFSGGNSLYCAGETARNNMIASDGWTITDGGLDPLGCSPCTGSLTTWDGTSWDNGVPDDTRPALIAGDYNPSPYVDIESCDCTINATHTLTVPKDNYLLVANIIDNNGIIEVEHEGTIIQNNNASNSGAGTYKIHKKTRPYTEYDYSYWSSPVVGATIGDVFNTNTSVTQDPLGTGHSDLDQHSLMSNIFWFDASEFDDSNGDGFDDNYDDWIHAPTDEIMPPARGYIAMGAGSDWPFNTDFATLLTQSLFFESNQLNNGTITHTLEFDHNNTDGYDNENLVGNPYASAIDLALLRNDVDNTVGGNPIIGATIKLWSHDTQITAGGGPWAYNFTNADYATYNIVNDTGVEAHAGNPDSPLPSKYLASCQSMVVEALQEEDLHFKNSMRVKDNNDNFFKTTSTADKFWLNMTTDTGLYRQIAVVFMEGADDSVNDFDSKRAYLVNETDFYSLSEMSADRLVIQGLAPFNEEKIVKLGMEIIIAGEYKLALDKVEGSFINQKIYLKDNKTNLLFDFSSFESYGFYVDDIELGIINDRFELRFIDNTAASVNDNNLIDMQVYPNPSTRIFNIAIQSEEVISIEVYDLTGKILVRKLNTRDRQIDLARYPQGLYFTRISQNDKHTIKKLILR